MTDGTDNHLMLWNLRPHSITGSKMEKACEMVHITANKNSIYGDTSPLSPYGLRIGTPALTSRGFLEKDFEKVADFLDQTLKIALDVQQKSGKLLEDFVKEFVKEEKVKILKEEIINFSSRFEIPGFDSKSIIKI